MKRVLKYPVDPCNSSVVIPSERILSVEAQGDTIVMYAMVENGPQRLCEYDVQIFGTGHPLPDNIDIYTFLGTVSMASGRLMWHVFYRLVGRSPLAVELD